MERKRELTAVDIAVLTGELAAITDAYVDKVYRYDEDLFRFRMRHFDHGRVELLLQVGELKRLHLADPANVPEAPGRPPQFAKMLRNRIGGAQLTAVHQYAFDRIVELEFDRPDSSTTIVAELFGDGNVVVLDANGQVIDSVRTVRLRSRTVAPGTSYEYPDAQHSPFAIPWEPFREEMRDSEADLVRTLATQLSLGGTYAEEVCARADVDGNRPVESATQSHLEALHRSLAEIERDIEAGEVDPRVYYEDDRRVDVVPFPLAQHADRDFETFGRFTDAVEDYFSNFTHEEEFTDAEADLEEELARQRRMIEQQESAIDRFEEQAAETREAAESLYANYDVVDDVLDTIRSARKAGRSWGKIEETLTEAAEAGNDRAALIESIDGEMGTVTLTVGDHSPTLRVEQSVEQNATRLYETAKEIEDKRDGAKSALEDSRAELARLQASDPMEEPSEPDDADDPTDWTARASIPVRKNEQWYEQFRWFHTSDNFLVIGGRNADENEALVKKYLEPGDRFVHTTAHGGPATILKATGPSERTREVDFPDQTLFEAAQFAVSYSSVWKSGQFGGDAYHVGPDQVSKTPESGETLEKGGFVIRGDREFIENVPVGVAVGIKCEPETRVIGGPPEAIEPRAATSIRVEPGRFAQGDVANRMYRRFRETFADTAFVRKVASPDKIQEFLPPGTSQIAD